MLGVCDADGIETLLRKRASPFHHVQLLSAIAFAEEHPLAGCFCAGTGKDSSADGFPADRVCGDAGARTPADQRAAKRNSFHGTAKIEAVRVTEIASARQANFHGSSAAAVPG